MITYQQLQQATQMSPEQLRQNPELMKALGITENQLSYPDLKRYIDIGFSQYSGQTGQSYGSTLDQYIRALSDPSPYIASIGGPKENGGLEGFRAKVQELIQGELNQAVQQYTKAGIDPSTIPWLSSKYASAGATPPWGNTTAGTGYVQQATYGTPGSEGFTSYDPTNSPLPNSPAPTDINPATGQPYDSGGTGTQQGGLPTGGGSTTYELSKYNSQLIDELARTNPLLADQFKDPKFRAAFENAPADMQEAYLKIVGVVRKQIELGNIINPDIEIEPSKVAEFLKQAQTEIDPYYQEVLGNYKQDLDISFSRLQEDYNKSIGRAEQPYKQGLADQAEAEAQSGTAFGSERIRRERENVQNQQYKLDDLTNENARRVQDTSIDAERKIGSENFRSLAIPNFNTYQASTQGFNQTGTRSLFSPQGNLMGELPKQREVDLSQRQSQLESDYRKSRILNVSPLGF